jgi:hypothetical protein
MHGLDASGWEGTCHVADAQTDDVLLGVGYLKCVYSLSNVREEVTSGKFQKMLIY